MKVDFTLEEWVKIYYNLSLINKMITFINNKDKSIDEFILKLTS